MKDEIWTAQEFMTKEFMVEESKKIARNFLNNALYENSNAEATDTTGKPFTSNGNALGNEGLWSDTGLEVTI